MPQLSPLVTTDDTFAVAGNSNGVSSWSTNGDTFNDVATVSVSRRQPSNSQTTRKTVLRLNRALTSTVDGKVISRGNVLYSLDIVSSVNSTDDERSDALAQFKELLANAGIEVAIVENEAYW